MLHTTDLETFSLKAVGPRPCFETALASDKTCYASFCLPALRWAPKPNPPKADTGTDERLGCLHAEIRNGNNCIT